MFVCSLCEHTQAAGGECEVCGRRLSGATESPTTSPLEGLEPTHLVDDRSAPVEVQPLPELEPTRASTVTAAPDPVPDLEPTRAAPVAAAAAAEPVPGLERTQADPLAWEERTPLLLAPNCRYCGTAAHPGDLLCGRCGMRLPVLQAAASSPEPQRPEGRCPSCGSLSRVETCPGCGGRVRLPESPPLANRA